MHVTSASASRASASAETFGTLRVALIAQFPMLLEALGCDPALVLRRAGIPRSLLARTNNRIGYHAVGRLLEESVRATGLAHFGLLVGEHFDPAVALGDIVPLMRNAPTVEAALRAFVLHHHLNDSGAVPMLLPRSARRVELAYSIVWHDIPAVDAFYDAALAYGMQIMRDLCGRRWRPLQVTLAHRRPVDDSQYRRVFGSHLRFDADVTAIEFPADLLQQPLAGADPDLYQRLRNDMGERLRRARISLVNQVRMALRPMILAGIVSQPGVASLFSMHERVLRRRLAVEGTTLRSLLLEARMEIATHLLRSTHLTVTEIGSRLGYADPPSFVRAFRKHFDGVTPGRWGAQTRSVQSGPSQQAKRLRAPAR
jgi:AraC-like DNA-binding protein